jgi:MATE family multidrug resistance protein
MADSRQPLLSPRGNQNESDEQLLSLTRSITNNSFASSFVADADDIQPINSVRDFFREFCREFIKLWYLAAPAIFTSVCQYSLGAITQVFSGHVGTLALAAVSIENSVIAGFSFGLMVQKQI